MKKIKEFLIDCSTVFVLISGFGLIVGAGYFWARNDNFALISCISGVVDLAIIYFWSFEV
ncbi:MAG TPA: hypothetical protein VMR41_05130 [Patescibacteria group bacterium]|nr:hypothetical protein [Patescibacteria group bacterium]